MANPEHVKVVRQGTAAIAEWRRRNPGTSLDLSGADLAGANLAGADLAGADLAGANLTGANLGGANLVGADLAGADLAMANLTGADLTGADLTAANLTFAELTRSNLAAADLAAANLTGADLTEASLAAARLDGTSLGDCDLSRATGLSGVKHDGPSSIGVDTLIASFRGAGNRLTPDLEAFFLGAGVPKELLARLPEIVGALEYYSCFIAYGQPDLDFAKRLRDDLAARGVSCWLYDLDATPGERIWPEIRKKQREADKMVVICSAAALIRDGVLKEIEEQIDDDPNKMVPISRDDIWIQTGFRVVRGSRDLGPFLRDRNYADFGDDSRYEDSLQRVLKALRRKAE
jgi:uncharacterized protein YjbI with pentapeptide repeats